MKLLCLLGLHKWGKEPAVTVKVAGDEAREPSGFL